jgi:uncharacterized protein (DUF1697 family)
MRYIAFIRGINVGGKNIIRMEDLSALFHRIGFTGVTTYIQSGNVLFDSEATLARQIEDQIENHLKEKLIGEIPVIVRSVKAIENLIGQDPFRNYKDDPELKLYVCFLKYRPEKIPPLPLISLKDGLEIIQINDLYTFVVSRKVKKMYGFPNNLVEKKLNVPATTRNWNTILKMIKK